MMIVNVITITTAKLRNASGNKLSLETYLHFYTFSTTKQPLFPRQEIATTSQI